jgi:hypothetical protein
MWCSSGNWPLPAARTPTPQWVWDRGAKFAGYELNGTEIPLFWDPIFKEHARQFLAEVARKFGNNPRLLFVDVTPGAETNPYRYAQGIPGHERGDLSAHTTGLASSLRQPPELDLAEFHRVALGLK